MTFSDFGLSAPILRALEEEGYAAPTPIQTQAIPGVLAGRDLLGIAQTGTGKTAAFALPILARLAANPGELRRGTCRVLVLSPTRELATQIGDSFRTYGRHLKLSVAVVFGGVGHRPQIDTLRRGVDILVATPGRLIDHLDERNISLESVETFVLDEADQMLDLGFVRPIRNIVSRLSKKRQNLFFSATMPFEIGALAAELLVEPLRVSVAPAATTVDRVAQRVILVEQARKRALLVELFANPDMSRTLVFTRTKRGADRVAQHLEAAGYSAAAIHGNKSQPQREKALAAFRDGKTRILVATDIAARGIDIEQVSHVINFELPEVPESYVHRIGRTARAGAEGCAIALVDQEERGLLRDIERLTRQQIPAEDRRGDETLKADARGAGGLRRERARSSGSDRGRSDRDRNGEGRGEPRRPREGAGERRSFNDRGPRQGGNRPSEAGGEHRHQRSDERFARRDDTRSNDGRHGGSHRRIEQRPDRNHQDRDRQDFRGAPQGERSGRGGDREPQRNGGSQAFDRPRNSEERPYRHEGGRSASHGHADRRDRPHHNGDRTDNLGHDGRNRGPERREGRPGLQRDHRPDRHAGPSNGNRPFNPRHRDGERGSDWNGERNGQSDRDRGRPRDDRHANGDRPARASHQSRDNERHGGGSHRGAHRQHRRDRNTARTE